MHVHKSLRKICQFAVRFPVTACVDFEQHVKITISSGWFGLILAARRRLSRAWIARYKVSARAKADLRAQIFLAGENQAVRRKQTKT
jgi:hypothetical protein